MKFYCTSVTVGRIDIDMAHTPRMLYLGTDKAEAIRIVDSRAEPNFESPKTNYPQLYSALPVTIERQVIRYYRTGDTWYSIVEFEMKENEDNGQEP